MGFIISIEVKCMAKIVQRMEDGKNGNIFMFLLLCVKCYNIV